MLATETAPFDVAAFLERDHQKDLLRFTTAGSVDDGKSTLIGRLLYDSQNVYEDQIRSIAKSTINRSAGKIDLSLLTDGLRAEREQGITIDVAYRYFTTARRKFIIADTPGHEQYTRNMATGASTADLAIILIDARNGVQTQSRRHAYIASLLGIPKFVVAINKMDLEGFSEPVFQSIREEFTSVLEKLGVEDAYFVPLSALTGDNVVRRSQAMRWFDGPSLLEHLETVDLTPVRSTAAFRLPVQRVIRPDQFFRGFAGQIASGRIRPGDEVTVFPSGRKTRVKSIESFEGPIDGAAAPMSVTLTLEEEVDISRGDMISVGAKPALAQEFEARVVWMNEQPLDPSRQYLLKHTTQTVTAKIDSITNHVDMKTLDLLPGGPIELNAIGHVRIETGRPIAFDPYRENRITGSAILIDPVTNATVGAVMIEKEALRDHEHSPIGPAERAARFGHRSAVIRIGNREQLAEIIERKLFHRGALPAIVKGWNASTASVIESIGAIAIVVSDDEPTMALPLHDEEAADRALAWLEEKKILRSTHGLAGGEGI
jgi:sulfate adenylyltransferase large subunit